MTAGVFQNMMHPRMRASATAVTSLVYSLIGGAMGPLVVGGLSDRLSGGLPAAMAIVAAGYLWAALHYLLAVAPLRRELTLPV